MFHSFIPLYNWGMGATLIAVFAVVCITLAILVIRFITTGKSKEEIQKEAAEKEKFTSEEE